jgi:hypothetical protein
LLDVLRAWWLQCRSQGWLFPERDPFLPITTPCLEVEVIDPSTKLLGHPAARKLSCAATAEGTIGALRALARVERSAILLPSFDRSNCLTLGWRR